ncbi:MAG: DUF3192 domain-containing protein [Candidatus Omnitrophica bacterium]|nr:DUF3192 domain-containing protein [Candidatus Omnitrophota bacterium]
MQKTILICLCCLSLAFTAPEELRTQNRSNLIKLQPGMPKVQVVSIMGTTTAEDFDESGTYAINNPYKTETLEGKKKLFEVLYYHTELKERDRSLDNEELTPLVLCDNKLLGWGWPFLREIVQKYEITYSFLNEAQV